MSYEGYEQWLCKQGHYFCFDCYSLPLKEKWECPVCGQGLAWTNGVDQTNGGEVRYVSLKIKTKTKFESCPTCEHAKVVEVETFKIPNNKGIKYPYRGGEK